MKDVLDEIFVDEIVTIITKREKDGKEFVFEGALKTFENKTVLIIKKSFEGKIQTYTFTINKIISSAEKKLFEETWQDNQINLFKIRRTVKQLTELKQLNPKVDRIIEIREQLK